MNLPSWWPDRLKSDYTPRGLFARVAIDLFLSNLGLFLGILTTVGIWTFTWAETSQAFFHQMVFQVWLTNVPMLTVCCLFAYAVNGLYRGTCEVPYTGRLFRGEQGGGNSFSSVSPMGLSI